MDRALPAETFRALFESAPGSFLVLDPDLRIVAVTDRYLNDTMRTRDELVGRHIFEAFPDNPDDEHATGTRNLRASLERVREDLVPDTMAVQKYDIQRPEGTGSDFEVRYWSPVNVPILDADGRLIYIIHRVEDVTGFIRLEEAKTTEQQRSAELEARTAQMETEILLRSAELQETNVRLRAANAAKTEFLSRMSHELRTPLNAIIGFAQLLELDALRPDQTEAVTQILKGGKHLLHLINEVLDLARIESGRLSLSLEPVPLADAIHETMDMLKPLAARDDVRLLAEEISGHHVWADRRRLVQVLLNLIGNAVKFSPTGAEVRVSCAGADEERIRISVRDTGPGIAADQLDRLFEPFDRLGADTTSIEGSGLGLAVSRRLVQAMGGIIGAESTPGEGSTFFFELPLAADPLAQIEDATATGLAVAWDGPARTILYIEDNLANLRLVERILSFRPNVKLLAAMNGETGLDLASEHRPDLILLDLDLPDIPGSEVLRSLQGTAATRGLPVLVVSAHASPEQIELLRKAGARDYVAKPLDMRGFLETIDAYLVRENDDA